MFYPDQYLHIEALFLGMSPERLLERIRFAMTNRAKSSTLPDITGDISEELYCHCARTLAANELRTEDEILQRHRDLEQYLKPRPSGGILCLLADYARNVLYYQNAEPRLRLEHILDWRERTLHLGQDIFTCAGLAREDIDCRRVSTYFSWPAAVPSDHLALRRTLARGMSENHAHMNGSTQLFSLTWSFLMNHPKKIRAYFSSRLFQRNLSPSVSFGARDNQREGADLLYLAAWLRAYLFRILLIPEWEPIEESTPDLTSQHFQQLFSFWDSPTKRRDLCGRVEALRRYGEPFSFSTANASCLDYAILPEVAKDNPDANRLLTGERFFLYRCFCRCFDRRMDIERERELAALFYLYLLIKIRFRRELIQTNGRRGFRNFSSYQDRKAVLWGNRPDYWEESYRLFIASAFEQAADGKNLLQSLETRISPERRARQLRSAIRKIDYATDNILQRKTGADIPRTYPRPQYQHAQDEAKYFFVLHFIKRPLEPVRDPKPRGIPKSRNAQTRWNVECQAKATAYALANDSYLCSRIRGIDASSHEIGCRPETFATAFRYLRRFSPQSLFPAGDEVPESVRYWPCLNATYHVGEDFLDLADGLRAIDEAICFLDLRRGDRLGHALALGVQPKQYYRVKEHYLYLPGQDLLDNIVWLLFRSLEWGVSIPSRLCNSLQVQGEQLLYKIYGNDLEDDGGICIEFGLADYYRSWKLRGDDPVLYLPRSPEGIKNRIQDALSPSSLSARVQDYERERLDRWLWDHEPQETLSSVGSSRSLFCGYVDLEGTEDAADIFGVRSSRKLQLLLHAYHYDLHARERGQGIARYQVDSDYIQLIHDMQEALMDRIMHKGIAIECNPSSNKLIGTFDKYEQHPIFRFNSCGLDLPEYPDSKLQLPVSVNTDDQGVFDTSLENEYTLLYGCLQQRIDSSGDPLVTDDAILTYLDHLRVMGNDMVFPKAEKGIRRKR